jgi:RNA polymerase sigma factor for flagellar operon FliA
MSVPHKPGLALVERPEKVEAALWRRLRFEQDIECRHKLFFLYQPRVQKVAKSQFYRRPNYGLSRLDFEQLAYEGLLQAIDRFDPLEGTPFKNYSSMRVIGAIADGIGRSSEGATQYVARRKLEQERLRSIRSKPKVSDLNPVNELRELVVELALGLILEETAMVADHNTPDPAPAGYESMAWKQLRQGVRLELLKLPEKELIVIEQHYMFGLSFSHIADLLGVTAARVSQLHRSGLNAMRARLKGFM